MSRQFARDYGHFIPAAELNSRKEELADTHNHCQGKEQGGGVAVNPC
jgi:hypothetical protein